MLLRLPPRLVLRLDAICDASLAIFLLASSWDALFEFLGLPVPKPALYAQLLGAALVGLAIVEWLVAGRPGQREVARGVAVGSALAATLIVVWLLYRQIIRSPRSSEWSRVYTPRTVPGV